MQHPLKPPFCYYSAISRKINSVTCGLGRAVGWMTFLMVIVTAVIVVMRTVFNSNSVGAQELVTYLHATVIMCASAYTLAEHGHVRVDIFYRGFSLHKRAWIDLIGSLLFLLPFALATVILSLGFVSASWATKEASNDAGGIAAVFILKSLLIVNGGLLAAQAISEALKQLVILQQESDQQASDQQASDQQKSDQQKSDSHTKTSPNKAIKNLNNTIKKQAH